jgi:dTDP-4-dehydrorhamnose reductase
MNVVVTGANGQLGQALQYIAGKYPEISFHFYGSADLDIVRKESISKVFESMRPVFCINAAAYTAVDKAESETDKAYAVNATGVKNLAEVCRDCNTTLIHISTDFVFDGNKETPYTETDATNPQGAYGQTKLDGESEILKISSKYFIIRTSWVYSQFGNNFMKTMLRLAQERDSLGVVSDQTGTPTHAVDLAETIVSIIQSESNNYGIYNFSNEGAASWYDFAKKIFEIHNIGIDLNPISTSDFPTPAKRPKYSVLDKSKIRAEFNIGIEQWDKSLEWHSST